MELLADPEGTVSLAGKRRTVQKTARSSLKGRQEGNETNSYSLPRRRVSYRIAEKKGAEQ